MKRWLTFIIVTVSFSAYTLLAEESPRGDLLELHSCQLYIGGCIASAEATQDGRYLLRVWDFSGGSHNGVPLAGLQVALLQTGEQNLAEPDTQPTGSLVYLPQSATTTQTAALLDWLKTTNPELSRASFQTRIAPMQLTAAHSRISFTVGEFLHVNVQPFESCGLTSCGESLWYTPRSTVTSYTVGVTSQSLVREPLLTLTWIDHGKNNVFQGRFGEAHTETTFNSPTMACVAADLHAHE